MVPRHVTHLLALLLAEIANERLKILTSLLAELQLFKVGVSHFVVLDVMQS